MRPKDKHYGPPVYTPWFFADNIMYKKGGYIEDEEILAKFSFFIVFRFMILDRRVLKYFDDFNTNILYYFDQKKIYKLLYYLIPKMTEGHKSYYIKKQKEDIVVNSMVSAISEYYEISKREAKDLFQIIPSDNALQIMCSFGERYGTAINKVEKLIQ